MENVSDIFSEKQQARALIKKRLSLLNEDERHKMSALLFQRLKELPELQKANTVYCFISIQHEPETRQIIEYLLDSGKRVCVPKCKSDGHMDARVIYSLDDLKPMPPFGIPEPSEESEIVDAAAIDFAIVPGLAFDRGGGRLGRGAGYYDRYLRGCCVICCGVCFDAMLFDHIPTGSEDVPMDMILTEKSLLRFNYPMKGDDINA